MSKGHNRSTCFVEGRILYTDDENTTGARLDSPAWFDWLAAGETFYYRSPDGSFTACCESRRGGRYWIAYRHHNGVLQRVYLGKSESVTAERLHQAAETLTPPGERALQWHAYLTALARKR